MATTPNMSIVKPVPLSDSNLVGANEVNTALDTIDAHNHTSGRGVQIPTLGLNINADLPVNAFALSNVGAVNLANRGGTMAASFKGYIYSAPGTGGTAYDLFYNDGAGANIQLTKAGGPNSVATGAITGLVSPASAAFATSTFTWQSNTNVPAKMDVGDILLRKAGATSPHSVTLQTVNSLASDISVTFPGTLPPSNLPVSMDGTGALTTGQIATAQIADANVTRPKLVAVGQQVSASSGNFTTALAGPVNVTNLSCSLTTSGRPVVIMLTPDSATSISYVGITASAAGQQVYFQIFESNTSTVVAQFYISAGSSLGGGTLQLPPGGILGFHVPAAGSYIYKLRAGSSGATPTATVQFCQLVAYEL